MSTKQKILRSLNIPFSQRDWVFPKKFPRVIARIWARLYAIQSVMAVASHRFFCFILLSVIALSVAAVFSSFPETTFAQGGEYTFLEPFPSPGEAPLVQASRQDLFVRYAKTVFNVSLGAAGILAVLMLVVAGVQYTLGAVSEQAKSDAKDRIRSAILGLLIVLAAYLILWTINPDLVRLELNVPAITEFMPSPGGAPPLPSLPPVCPGCNPAEGYSFPQKAPGAGCSGSTCYVEASLGSRLEALNADLQGAGISWRVNEMYPPTRTHSNSCHQYGTCVDASITGSQTPANILIFQEQATANGLRAQYEVASPAREAQLRAAGVTDVRYVPGITGEHFSIYSS